jgi:hypothetical protein
MVGNVLPVPCMMDGLIYSFFFFLLFLPCLALCAEFEWEDGNRMEQDEMVV